jgi:hypothetical protein
MTDTEENTDWYDLGWRHGYDDEPGPEFPENEEYMEGWAQGCMDC